MKRIIKVLAFLLLSFNISFAFAGTIDHFEVEFNKDKAEVGEALDLTIKAVDKNGDIVKDYTGNILGLSQTDDTATLPEDLSSDSGYTFKLSDQGVKKFENGVIFNNPGEQTISIYDTSDYENLTGEGQITIVPASSNNNKKVEIEILTPETNTTIATNKIKVSGATKKNHQVEIEVNGKEKFTTTSNSDGVFEKEITLQTGKNTLKAYILDADNNVIGESKEVIIKVDDNKPVFKKIILSPVSKSGSVEEGTNVNVKVYATSKLKTVKLLFNDGVIALEETEDGVYSGNFKAPSEEKIYPIDVVLADELGHTVTKKDVAKLKVYLVEKNSAGTGEILTPPQTCSGITDPNLLKVTGIKVVKLKTKSILTWDKNKYAQSYDVYEKNKKTNKFEFLKNVKEPKIEFDITGDKIKYQYFAIQAKAKGCENGKEKELTGDLSQATKVQTGPTQIIIMILLSLILGLGFIIVKRKNS